MNRNNHQNHLSSRFLFLIILVGVGGCGYSHESLLPANVRSVYVPIFDNRTFRRGLEFDLTEAVKNEILLKTDLTIAPKHKADTILIGEIVDFREHVLVENENDEPTETQVEIIVDLIWKDRRTGRVLRNVKGLRETAEFIVARRETLGTATDESFRYVAERIVEALEEDW